MGAFFMSLFILIQLCKLQLHLMNTSVRIKNWIDQGCDFKAGVEIYEELGDNSTLKKLFLNKPTRFFQDKLYEELLSIKNNFDTAQIITPDQFKMSISDFEKLPDKLKRLDKEKSMLFQSIIKHRSAIKKLVNLNYNGRITIGDALDIMTERDRFKRLKPFSVTYISYNASRRTGGDIIRFHNCTLSVINKTGSKIMKGDKFYSKNQPNHWINATRNFTPYGSNEIKKLHIWLMIEFNGMEVVTSELG